MARLIRHEHDGPIKIEPQDKPVFVCACGLSREFPICDGSHKACRDEQAGTVYVYEGHVRRVVEEEGEGKDKNKGDAGA